jgi:hypothetical protein
MPWLVRLSNVPSVNRGVSFALATAGRNWHSPGSRITGIRAADVHTGGPVSIHSAAVKQAVSVAVSEFVGSLHRPTQRRNIEQMRALQAEMRDLARKRPRDPEAERLPRASPDRSTQLSRLRRAAVAHDAPDLSTGGLVTAQPDPS